MEIDINESATTPQEECGQPSSENEGCAASGISLLIIFFLFAGAVFYLFSQMGV